MLNRENQPEYLNWYAAVATAISGALTFHLVYTIAAANVDQWIAGLAAAVVVAILDGGFWLWDHNLPRVRSRSQRKLIIGALVLWWLMMLITSFTDGLRMADVAQVDTAAYGIGISVIIASVAGNLIVLIYTWFRYLDPDMRQKLARAESEIAIVQQELHFDGVFAGNVARDYGRRRAESRARRRHKDEFGDELPDHYLQVSQEAGQDSGQVPGHSSGQNGHKSSKASELFPPTSR